MKEREEPSIPSFSAMIGKKSSKLDCGFCEAISQRHKERVEWERKRYIRLERERKKESNEESCEMGKYIKR